MADENFVRSYRSVGPARRPIEPASDVGARGAGARDAGARDEDSRGDPLAELARLIGQTDPFADPPPASPRGRTPSLSQVRGEPAPASDWRATAAALAREALQNPPMDDPPYEQADPQVERINSAIEAIDSYRTQSEPYYAEPEHSAFEEEHDRDRHYDEEAPYHGMGEASQYAQEAAQPHPHEDHEEANYFFDGEVPPPDPDQRFYDDPPRARRGNGLVTAAVLVGCALLGTAGAYGYRSYYAGTRATDAPIISADPTPSKVVPASADSGKPVQERVADSAPDERIVTHAEEPVTLGAPTPAPRVVLPAPFAPAPGAKPSPPPSSISASASNAPVPANAGSEPKKVRTVPIKPDGSDAAMRPLTTASTPPPAQATLPAPPAPARPAPSTKPAPQPRSNSGPLSLEPGAPGTAPAAAAPAAAAPAERSPKLASVASGAYVVQISSQTSEAEAHASFRTLQAKYPHELGDRDAMIERGDTPSGVRYRAMVGPFASMADAQQFCSKYKAAGGDCFARKN